MFLYLDIETIPSQSSEVHAALAEKITHPGNISKPESIAAWEAEKKPALVKEAIAKTALDGSAGHICCIGWAFDDELVKSWSLLDDFDETEVLSGFFEAAGKRVSGGLSIPPIIVGHNVASFDIRFIWQRAIVLGVRVPNWFPRNPKPWDRDVFDTMFAFSQSNRPNETIGLDRLCKALGIPGKDDIDGSMVGELWAAGEYDRIAEYCRADVERTRAVHRKMQIAYGEADFAEAAE